MHPALHKTLSFAMLHFAVAFSVTWALTGSWLIGSAVALIEPAINTLAFYFHERLWQRRAHFGLQEAVPTATLA